MSWCAMQSFARMGCIRLFPGTQKDFERSRSSNSPFHIALKHIIPLSQRFLFSTLLIFSAISAAILVPKHIHTIYPIQSTQIRKLQILILSHPYSDLCFLFTALAPPSLKCREPERPMVQISFQNRLLTVLEAE